MDLNKQDLETIWYSAVLLKSRLQSGEEDPDLTHTQLEKLSEKIFINWWELKESEQKLSKNAWIQESFLGDLF